MNALVDIEGLRVDYRTGGVLRTAVENIDLRIEEGESHGLVGESGSGKSSIALALTRFLPRGASVESRRLEVAGRDLRSLDGAALREYRRRDIGVVYQEPARALNPTARVGAVIAEVHRLRGLSAREAARAAENSLDEVGLHPADALARRYPHELSGGQQQRVMVAMALAGRPRLLILDEPTTALDGSARADILDLIDGRRREYGLASLTISHELDLIASWCDRVSVLGEGREIETRGNDHPHRSSSTFAHAGTRSRPVEGAPVLVAAGLGVDRGGRAALSRIDLHIGRGETLAVVGESGSGKSTLGRALAGIVSHRGDLAIEAAASRHPVQMVFQSPESSLNPRRSVRRTLSRAIALLGGDGTPDELAERVGLSGHLLDRFPHELSGGQKQRVAIARALAGDAPIVVCDEPTSSLDAAAATGILDLLIDLQDRTGVAYLFISHDLGVVRRIAHRVVVMSNGHLEETATAESFFRGAPNPHSTGIVRSRAREGIGP